VYPTLPASSLTETIKEKLLNQYEVRPFPQVVVKLLEAIRNPNVSISTISQIVQSDIALCTKVLRIANSPLIGAGYKVTRIDQAITILGFNRIKSLAQTHAAATIITGSGSHIEIRRALWQHSLACATACRVIASTLNVADEADAFLAGIFHDVGHLFFLDTIPQVYVPMVEDLHPLKIAELETWQFGVDHQEVGTKLSLAWDLPSSTRTSIGFHHRPQKAIAHEEFAWIVHLADLLVHAYHIGSSPNSSIMQAELIRGPFGLSTGAIKAIRTQTINEFAEFQRMYD
jgi:HD-like signal output (HDOD) protein